MRQASKLLLSFILYLQFSVSFVMAQVQFIKNPIATNFIEPWSIQAIDMDGDSDIDIVASARLGHKLAWWENTGSQSFTMHTISNFSYYAMGIYAIDIDEDSNVDVFCASQTNGVELWVNQGNQTFIKQIIGSWPFASFLYAEDVDSDQDFDIIVSCCEGGSNRMGWIENMGNLIFSDHIVISNWAQANSAYALDINRDGHMDLLGTSSGRETGTGEIAWFENDSNQVFTKHLIYSTHYRPSCAIALDLDLDTDIDIVASVCEINQIIWFENIGNEVFVQNPIGYGFSRALSVDTADFDNDGDIDILTDAINFDKISWLENDGSQNFSERIVTNSYDGAADIYTKDLDRDGDTDILATAHYADQLTWWENKTISKINNKPEIPLQIKLYQNYPNPFNPETVISYQLSEFTKVELIIYNSLGKKVKTLVKKQHSAGEYSIVWSGKDDFGKAVSSGIYHYQLKIGKNTYAKKMIFIR